MSLRPENDPVEHPPHYTTGHIEVIDFILDQNFGYLDGQVVRYVSRYRWKGKPLEDLRKARWYLDKLIEQLSAAEKVADALRPTAGTAGTFTNAQQLEIEWLNQQSP